MGELEANTEKRVVRVEREPKSCFIEMWQKSCLGLRELGEGAHRVERRESCYVTTRSCSSLTTLNLLFLSTLYREREKREKGKF